MLALYFLDKKIIFGKRARRRARSVNTKTSTAVKQDYLKNKEIARGLINSRLQYFSRLYNIAYGRVSIRNQKSRWGSCSRQGNLNFNYRLLYLSDSLRDYVIVHELCHIREFNHGKNFWSLVSQSIPDYKELRREIKKIRLS